MCATATEWGHTQLNPPGWQMCVRGGFACGLHQGASGRCWVSKAGFLIIWSPAHGHGGSCLFLRFHTAPHCLIANAASPHRLLSSMCATLLWSMANKYERPAARGGMEGGGYKWYFCGPCKQFMKEMTGWFQETNVKEKQGLTCTPTLMAGTPVGLIASCGYAHHSQKEKKKKQERIVLHFFSSDTPSPLLLRCSQQFVTVSTSYQKQVLFSLQRLALFFFFSGGARKNLLQAHKQCVDMFTFLARCQGTQKNGCRVFFSF